MALVRQLRRHLLDAEAHLPAVGEYARGFHLQRERVELRLAHAVRPPDAGVLHLERRSIRGREADGPRLARGQRHRLREADPLHRSLHHAGDGPVGRVLHLGRDRDPRRGQRRQIEVGDDVRALEREGPAVRRYTSPTGHVLVVAAWVPIHPHDREVVGLRAVHLHRQRVLPPYAGHLRDVERVRRKTPATLAGVAIRVPSSIMLAVVDPVEVSATAAGPGWSAGRTPCGTPRQLEGAVGWLGMSVKRSPILYVVPGNLRRFHPEIRSGTAPPSTSADHRVRNPRPGHPCGGESNRGDRIALRGDLGRGLICPLTRGCFASSAPAACSGPATARERARRQEETPHDETSGADGREGAVARPRLMRGAEFGKTF